MIERHIARLNARHRLSEAEEQAVRGLISSTRTVPARTVVAHHGQRLHHSTLLLDGLLCRYKQLPDGRRQIAELQVPGDFADMHSFTLKRLDHEIQALAPSLIGIVPHERILEVIEAHPRLARIYWFGTNLDAAIHREWELSLGCRSAAGRLAALFCEMNVRLSLVGLAEPKGFKLPLTQADLSECLGLTAVHVNRTLKQLREDKLAVFQNRYVTLLDQAGLRTLANFADDYLYLHPDEL